MNVIIVVFAVGTYFGICDLLAVVAYKISEKLFDDQFYNDPIIWFVVMTLWPATAPLTAAFFILKYILNYLEERK